MPEWISEASIAAGADAPLADFDLVTALVTSPVIPFVEPQTVMRNRRGIKRVAAGSGVIRRAGYKSATWLSSQLWVVQWNFLVATYEGECSIKTTFDGITWAYFNAVLDCGDLEDYGDPVADTQYGNYLPDFKWLFTRLESYTPDP